MMATIMGRRIQYTTRRLWSLVLCVSIILIVSGRPIYAISIWGRIGRHRRPPPRPPQLPPFMAPVEDAFCKLQTEALARIDDGKRGLESAAKTYDVSSKKTHVLLGS